MCPCTEKHFPASDLLPTVSTLLSNLRLVNRNLGMNFTSPTRQPRQREIFAHFFRPSLARRANEGFTKHSLPCVEPGVSLEWAKGMVHPGYFSGQAR